MLDILFGGLCKVSPPMVSGQVRLADGSPVAGAQVVLLDVADLGRGPMGQATTDEAGQFALPLAASGAFGLPQGFALGPNYPNPFGSVLNNNKSLAYLAKRGR